MPLLNTATKIYKGSSPVDRVYRGAVQVWPPAPAYGPPQSAYTSQTPTTSSSFSSTATVRGNDFVFATAGRVTGMRFYRHATATATGRTMRMWTYSSAVLLGTCATSGDSGSGWKTAMFGSPVAVTAGQRVRAVLEHPSGPSNVYGRVPNYASDIINGDLTMKVQGFQGPTPGAYPASGDPNTFFVDVIFERAL